MPARMKWESSTIELERSRNPSRQTSLQFGQLLLLALLFAARSVAQVPETQESRASALGFAPPSSAEIDHAIALAANYLEGACGPDGRFIYRINISSGQQSHSYNVVRHAGTIYALGMLQHDSPVKQAFAAMNRAATFLRHNYIGPGPRPGQLAVWSKPLPQISSADLGATGLGLVALTSLEQAKPDSMPLDQLQALGSFLLFLQRADGSFVSKYSAERGPDESFESLYYPGEAALGLIDLYETDHSPVWLAAAARALSYLARSRAKLLEVPPDHWALIATAKLLPYYAQSASPASREELLQHAVQICQALMKGQLRNSENRVLDGSFDPTGRTAPSATRVEGLLAALEFLPSGNLRTQIKDTVDHAIAFLLRAQIRDGLYAGGMPGLYALKFPENSAVRIDFVQHAMCAWLRYKRLFRPDESLHQTGSQSY